MGLLDKLFRRKEKTPPITPIKISPLRALNQHLQLSLENAKLRLYSKQLFMHYWTEGLTCNNPNDPVWQHQALFFWESEEPFPKKALPAVFETMQQKRFILRADESKHEFKATTVMPWHDMPGQGTKYCCMVKNNYVTLQELHEQGFLAYITPIHLTADNAGILEQSDEYYFFVDQSIVQYHDGYFTYQGQMIPLHLAYSLGGVHIVKGQL